MEHPEHKENHMGAVPGLGHETWTAQTDREKTEGPISLKRRILGFLGVSMANSAPELGSSRHARRLQTGELSQRVKRSVTPDQYQVYKVLTSNRKVRIAESSEMAPINEAVVAGLRPARSAVDE